MTNSHTRLDVEKLSRASIPLLTYHHLDTPGTRWSVSTEQLNEQMKWLYDHGYTPITMSQLLDAMVGTGDVPAHAVVITNDDGHPESLRFAEILERHGASATYFLPTDMRLSTDQIRNLDQHGEIGGHTVTHADLSRLSSEGQRAEITTNKLFLESVVGHPIRCFAYPYGAFTSDTVRIVREIRYDSAVLAGRVHSPHSTVDPYQIPRIPVLGTQELPEFVNCVQDVSQCCVLRN